MDIVDKFQWILQHFNEIQPLHKMEFVEFIDQFYNRIQLSNTFNDNFSEQLGNGVPRSGQTTEGSLSEQELVDNLQDMFPEQTENIFGKKMELLIY